MATPRHGNSWKRRYLTFVHSDYLRRQTGVGVVQAAGHLVLAGDGLDLADQADDRLVLLVGLAQRRLELLVRVQQALDLLHGVHDEHVDQVLARTVQPVVERLQSQHSVQPQDSLQVQLG